MEWLVSRIQPSEESDQAVERSSDVFLFSSDVMDLFQSLSFSFKVILDQKLHFLYLFSSVTAVILSNVSVLITMKINSK